MLDIASNLDFVQGLHSSHTHKKSQETHKIKQKMAEKPNWRLKRHTQMLELWLNPGFKTKL